MSDAAILLYLASLLCVPLFWVVPRTYRWDALALWTILCLAAVSPYSALWLLWVALFPPLAMLLGERLSLRGITTTFIGVVLLALLLYSRELPNLLLIGGAYFTLRAMHVVLEWWMGRIENQVFAGIFAINYSCP